MIRIGKLEGVLLLSFLLLFSFSLLYIFRTFDNNTLVSWKWVFGDKGFLKVLPYLILAIVLSLVISQYLPLEKFPVVVLVATGGLSVLFMVSEPELLLDSGRYFLQAKSLSEYGIIYYFREWGHAISSWTDMPLVPFLYGLAFKWGHESRLVIQLLNSLIFILAIVLTCRIGALLWNRETGFYAGLMLTGIPYLLTQVPQLLVDVHAMFFHLLAVYCFLRAIQSTDRLSVCLAAITIVLAAFAKYSTWPMLALLPVAGFVVYLQERRRTVLKRAAIILLSSSVPALILLFLKLNVFSEQIQILLQYQKPALKLWNEGLFSSFAFQFQPFISMLVLISAVRAWRLRDRRFLILSIYLLAVVLLQIRRIRYMIPLMPFITLAASYGLVAFNEIKLRRFIGSLVVSTSLAMLLAVYLPFLHTTSMMNIKEAGEALNKLEGESVSVTVLPQLNSEGSTFIAIPLLDYFTEKTIYSRQRWPAKPPGQIAGYSPLLFTWNLKEPPFYKSGQDQRKDMLPAVVISADPTGGQDRNRRHTTPSTAKTQHFDLDSGTFRFRTLVTIYD